MVYFKPLITQIAVDLLYGLFVLDPTSEQIVAAESLIVSMFNQEKSTSYARLSLKEWKCLYLASQGKSLKETAHLLCLSVGTVKNYRLRLKKKLQCKTLMQAIYAMAHQEELYVLAKQ